MAKFVLTHVRRVLGPAEAGLDEGEAGLHEDHQDGTEDDPEQVRVLGEGVDVFDELLSTRHAGERHRGQRGHAEADEGLGVQRRPSGRSGTRT